MLYKTLGKIARALATRRHRQALLRHRVLAATEHRRAFRTDFATVIDLGANRGQFALVARDLWPAAKITSFEPLLTPAKVFRSIFAGDRLTEVHQVAIGPTQERRQMYVAARDDSSSLLHISATQTATFPGTHEVSATEVQIAPLDRYIKREDITAPALLKIDVQGFEYEALRGCDTLLDCFDTIYCECSFVELYLGQGLASDVIHWLSARGFALMGIYNVIYDNLGRTVQADCEFRRQSREDF